MLISIKTDDEFERQLQNQREQYEATIQHQTRLIDQVRLKVKRKFESKYFLLFSSWSKIKIEFCLNVTT